MPRFAEHAAQPAFLFRKDQRMYVSGTTVHVAIGQWAKGHQSLNASTSRVVPMTL